jgi:putative Ca2+/H+ antiporter (TMEM165/GDT1 family)
LAIKNCRVVLRFPHQTSRQQLEDPMETILQSFSLVFLGEMGDKTQLLALILAARYRRPWLVLGAISVATLANHALSAWLGGFAAHFVPADWLRWGLTAAFLACAAWMLIPDEIEEEKTVSGRSAFLTTLIVFFWAEMGDKTQLATIALGARFQAPVLVTLSTTAGMIASNALAIFLGAALVKRIPWRYVRWGSSLLFALSALWIFLQK